MGVDAVGAADALYEAISAGVPKENAIAFLETSTKAAIAGVTTTKVAVDGMTSAMNAFKIPFEQTEKTANEMFMAVNIGKFTFEELANSMGVASSMAAITGVHFNEMVAAAATMTKQGITVSQAMTQIRSELTALNKPGENLKKIFADLGVQTGSDLITKFGGFQKATEAISASATKLGMTQAQVFGRIEATKGMLMLTGQQADTANQDLLALENTTNQLGKAFNDIDDTPARRWARAITEFKDAMIDAGNQALPIFEGLAKGTSSVIAGFEALPGPVKGTMVSTSLLVGTMGLAVTAGIRLREVMGSLSRAMTVQEGANVGAINGLGKLSIALLAVAAAYAAIDMTLRATTGDGILEHIMGGSGGAEKAKKDLQEIEDKLAAIDAKFPLGSSDNIANRKSLSTDAVNQVLSDIDKLNKAMDEQRKKFSQGSEVSTQFLPHKEIDQLSRDVTKAMDTIGNAFGKGSKDFDQFMGKIKESAGADLWKKLVDGGNQWANAYEADLKIVRAFRVW
jgi:TP901 family phage tail tape measure protein